MERKSDKSSINKTHIWVAVIIGAAIFGYGLLNFISKENERTNQSEIQRKEQETKKSNAVLLETCLSGADIRMNNSWKDLCKAKGLKEDCLQSLDVVEVQDKRFNELKNECFKKYPQ